MGMYNPVHASLKEPCIHLPGCSILNFDKNSILVSKRHLEVCTLYKHLTIFVNSAPTHPFKFLYTIRAETQGSKDLGSL